MEDKYSKGAIRMRLEEMRKETGGESGDLAVLSRMAHEFGVDESRYNVKMSDKEIVETTFNYQTNPSPLETEVEREERNLLAYQYAYLHGC